MMRWAMQSHFVLPSDREPPLDRESSTVRIDTGAARRRHAIFEGKIVVTGRG